MKKAVSLLPEDYKEIYAIDLQKNKKMSLFVNLAAVLILLVMAIPMHFYCSVFTLFDMSKGLLQYALRFVVMFLGLVVYMVLHELVHGVTMKLFGTKKVKYGFTGVYAFAGSSDLYPKWPYIIIALAPVVVWGIVLAVINCLVPENWFWVVYLIQIANISGAAGDFFVTFKFSRMPSDILVADYGVGMKVYSKNVGE